MSSPIPVASTPSCWERCDQENICIVLLVGIPASGKTYLRTLLENYFTNNSKTVLGTVKLFSVSYDEFCKVKNPNQFSGSVSWKDDRVEIFKKVEQIISNLKNCISQDNDIALENIRVITCEVKKPDTVLFIIDDNMYYRSMRYEYYKLSRCYNLGFCQIFLEATIQDALKYNKKRESESQVPDFVIERMFEKLEPPNKNLSWEKNVLNLTAYSNFEEDGLFDSVIFMIETALKYPLQQNLKSLNKEEAQRVNSSNAIHQIDIMLKQLVGELIKKRIKDSSCNVSKISLYFSEQRLEILKKIKDRKIVLPVDLCDSISEEDIVKIKPILSELLDSSLAL